MEEKQINTLGLPHLRRALVEEKRPIMYKVMKYWGKKPHNIFRTYVEHYSKENEIVLDPFAGSGVCLIEAIQVNRKAIAMDLNPISIFFIDRLITQLDINKFKNEYSNLKKRFWEFELKSGLYLTKCESCGKNGRVINLHYNDKNPYYVTYSHDCSKKSKRGLIKKPDSQDLDLIKNSDNLKIEWWFPQDEFPNSETFYEAKSKVGNHFYELWTKRNLYILSYINSEIEKIEDVELKKFFKFAFASMLHLCSKMVSARDLRSERPFSGSWGRPAYFFPAQHLEQNPFVLFERAIEDKQGLIKAKQMSNKLLSNKVRIAKDYDDLRNNDKNVLIIKANILDIKDIIPENEIYYILTDPPYGNLIQYFDLSSIWSVWLKGSEQDKFFDMPYNQEVIAKSLKDLGNYENMMINSLKNLYKILIPDRYLTLTFHNSNPVVYDLIMKICFMSGFVVEKVQFQPNRRASESGVANPYGSAISDYYIRLRKPSKEEVKREGLNKEGFEKVVVETAKRVLANRGQYTELPFLISDIITEIYQHGQYFTSTQDLKKILEKRLGEDFVKIEIAEDKLNKKLQEKWWLKNPEKVIRHSHIPLSDRIERTVISALQDGVKISFEQVLKKLYEEFPNSLTPATDGNKVKRLLSEYADKTPDGKWILNRSKLDKSTTKHLQIIILLAQIGKRLGFDIWSADRNKNEELKKICLDKLDLNEERIERIKEIDVIWLNKDKIIFLFEVENTTAFTEALIRASNIITQKDKIVRVIAIPKIRIELLKDKLKEPLFDEYYKKDDWKVILYEDIDYLSHRRNLTLEEFCKFLVDKPESKEKQSTIS